MAKKLGWPHSVRDTQIVGACAMRNEPAAPAAVLKIEWWPDHGPAGNSPPQE
jgi:hypothetical protein